MSKSISASTGIHKAYSVLWFFLAPSLLFLPYLCLDHGYFWGNPDSLFYANVYALLRDGLYHGDGFSRWVMAANIGLGSPVFYMYPPLAYWLSAVIALPFTPLQLTLEQQYLLGIYASEIIGGWGMWRFLSAHFKPELARIGANLFVLMPYAPVMLYMHFNLAQFWAMAVLPFWFAAAHDLTKRSNIFLYGLCFAACFYCHPLTIIAAAPFVFIYAFYRASWRWRKVFLPLVVAHLLGFCLCAGYWAGMYTAHPFIQADSWNKGALQAINNLYHVDIFVGLYLPLIAWVAYRVLPSSVIKPTSGWTFWCIALVVLYALATPLSYPVWWALPALSVIQFPFARLQPCMAVAGVMVVMHVLSTERKNGVWAICAIMVMFMALSLVRIGIEYRYHPPADPLLLEVTRRDMILPPVAYMPSATSLTPNDVLQSYKEWEAQPRLSAVDGKATIVVIEHGQNCLDADVDVTSASTALLFAQFYFPAWTALVDNKITELSVYGDGLINIKMEQGKHHVRFEIVSSLLETVAGYITRLAIVGCFLWFAFSVFACVHRAKNALIN